MTVDQEIALGLQAAPEMAAQYGGLHPNQEAAAKVKEIGARLVQQTKAGTSPYKFDFHLLADEKTLNAFAWSKHPTNNMLRSWRVRKRFLMD